MAGEFAGWQSYRYLRVEDAWGTKDTSSPVQFYFPYTQDDISVKPQFAKPSLYLGRRQQEFKVATKATCDGTLASPLWAHQVAGKSLAQYFIEAAYSGPASPTISSFTGLSFDNGNDDKQHLGLRINTLNIAGSNDGDGLLTMSAGVMGKQEANEASIPALDPANEVLSAFSFGNVSLWMSDENEGESASSAGELVDIRSFELSLANTLTVYHSNSYFPSRIVAGVRVVGFKFSVFKDDNTYDLYRRSDALITKAAHLQLKGYHRDTGGAAGDFTVIDAFMDKLAFGGATDTRDINGLAQIQTEWEALKPATSENEIEFAYTTE